MQILDLKQATEHLSTLALWHQQEWAHLNPGETLKQRTARMQPYLNHEFIPSMFIAQDKTLLGSAAIVENDMAIKTGLSPWLASVFVSPEHRKKGVATELVDHVMTQAKNHGVKTLYLYTPDQSPFYEKQGWQTHSKVQYHGHSVTIMQLTLNKD